MFSLTGWPKMGWRKNGAATRASIKTGKKVTARQPRLRYCKTPITRGVRAMLRLAATLASVMAVARCSPCRSASTAWIMIWVRELAKPMPRAAVISHSNW